MLANALPTVPDSWTQLGVAALLIVALAWLGYVWITTNARKPVSNIMSSEQLVHIIRENTEINAKLVTAVEQQTRVIQDLATAVNRLLGRLEG